MQVPESEVQEEHIAPCSEAGVYMSAWLRRKQYIPREHQNLARCFSELRANIEMLHETLCHKHPHAHT